MNGRLVKGNIIMIAVTKKNITKKLFKPPKINPPIITRIKPKRKYANGPKIEKLKTHVGVTFR